MSDYAEIINLIPVGRENAIDRHELREIAHVSDRKLRRLIQEAKEDGELIINLQDGKGYYRSEELYDMFRQYSLNQARIKSLSKQQKWMRKLLKEGGWLK